MTSKYYQKHKEKLQKETCEKNQNLSGEQKDKRQKRPEKHKNVLLKKKKKKNISIVANVIKKFLRSKRTNQLSIEEIAI